MRLKLHFFVLVLSVSTGSCFGADQRAELWRRVNEAVTKGLPKTAVTNLEPIIAGALKDHAYAEATKAIAKRITLETPKLEERIVRLDQEASRAPEEMKPALESLLAQWYWQYFQANRWRFNQRSATAQPPGKDFTTWDLPRLAQEIDRQFARSLSDKAYLKSTPISAWDDLIQKGTMPDNLRPTLYDFLAREALDFYTGPAPWAAGGGEDFELPAGGPVFLPVADFLDWADRISGAEGPKLVGDTNAPTVKAVKLFRDLLRFHQNDPAPRSAFAAVDLDRLSWGWNVAFGEEKNSRYQTALEEFVRNNGAMDLSALADEREARLLQGEGDLKAARDLAARGARLFPNSVGGALCRNLIREIEGKSLEITTEHVWNAPWPKISVGYRNITNLFFRAIPLDWESFLQRGRNLPGYSGAKEKIEVLSKTPAMAWSASLPSTADYKEAKIAIDPPAGLKPGYYFIFASPDEGFGAKDNIVSAADVWVSELSLILRPRAGDLEGFVLEANSGEPVQAAGLSVWALYDNGNWRPQPNLATDGNGFFSMKADPGRSYVFRARQNGRELASPHASVWSRWNQNDQNRPATSAILFTDRAIYRPGQIIQYKGICLRADPAADQYETLKGELVTVSFLDANGREIARERRRANDYGSFTGSFTAPRDRLMGQMSLKAEGWPRGTVAFRVEEYKRPKFEAALDAPKTAAKLNEPARVTGRATAYTGAPVDGAEVRYRVTRESFMPWWHWGPRARANSSEIAHGVTRTDSDGSFHLEFLAKPDPKILEKDEPTFVFQVSADVTDSAGETRSANRNLRVGYAALEATLHADDWQTEGKQLELKVGTRTLDGDPQVASGRVKIYLLRPPENVRRTPMGGPLGAEEKDLSDPNNWPLGGVVVERGLTTDTNGEAKVSFPLAAGAYRAVLETQDRFGKSVTARLPLRVVNPEAARLAIKIPHLLAAPGWEAQPGGDFDALWGTGYDSGRAFIEIEHRNNILQRFWTEPGRTQQAVKFPVTEAMRGGFTLHVTQVRENRAYLDSREVSVPWKNKELRVEWEHFISKLRPGSPETWTAVVTGPGAEKASAEIAAVLYDESLDAFAPHTWPRGFDVFRRDSSDAQPQFFNFSSQFGQILGAWISRQENAPVTYRRFPSDLGAGGFFWRYRLMNRGLGFDYVLGNTVFPVGGVAPFGGSGGIGGGGGFDLPGLITSGLRETVGGGASGPPSGGIAFAPVAGQAILSDKGAADRPGAAAPPVDLSKLSARQNLNETAFFFPQLRSDSNGVVRMTFTMPEALTKWRFLGFAHDQKLRSGFLEARAFTAKELMVQPNPPRFLREGDTVEFTAKVSNQSDRRQQGRARLSFAELDGGRSADQLLGNARPEQEFDLPAKESRGLSWRVTVPDGAPFLSYKATAAAGGLSDGEEGPLPVLSRQVLVTESIPLPIRGPATKKFEFIKLEESARSKTLRSRSLTVQMVSNPAWYAVLALPYLMEYPYQCSEQTFNRYYANALARRIATSDPKIRAVFDQWKNTPALDSPLEKNQDLKSVLLEETPWLGAAKDESQARRNVGVLFDENRLNYESDSTLRKLTDMQLGDGRWPWFPGGPANEYITLYLVTGFGRLRHLGAKVDPAPAARALPRLDEWMAGRYDEIQKRPKPEAHTPSPEEALYLYGRSFFLNDQPIAPRHKTAVEFFLGQSRKFWLRTNCRQSQGQLALALKRWGGDDNLAAARAIMRSLKERSASDPEFGMFWRDTELGWWWHHAPIETQALMIEAFDEVMSDTQSVEDCRVWLLKQKQTQNWKTTKATADAVYALLLRGADLLSRNELVKVSLGGKDFTPDANKRPNPNPDHLPAKVEAGTGFYEVRFEGAEIKPKLGKITVTKSDPDVAWGGAHWQYLEDVSKITPNQDNPLRLTKTLYNKTNSARGPVLEPVKGPVSVGDELVVRIELRADRDMEYVHLKDQRGSGTEPVNVLSRYKYQDGLAYYESTRDTASHFFIDYLPKGVYVFEYSSRVQLRGEYQTGVAEIQCLYAPEFNAHSGSVTLRVR